MLCSVRGAVKRASRNMRVRWYSTDKQVRAAEMKERVRKRLSNMPDLVEFMSADALKVNGVPGEQVMEYNNSIPYLVHEDLSVVGRGRRVFVESYGCQMNVNDSQIVCRIMHSAGFELAKCVEDADVVLLNTCAIRDHAEQKIWSRLGDLRVRRRGSALVVGVLGCMAERLKEQILEREKLVDLVAGPDAYRDLPWLVSRVDDGERAVQVILSQYETYADIAPVREDGRGVSAFVSISRGCNQHCTYCIVPKVRGIERSRPAESIENEIRELSALGYKEVVLLGQNVNSYNDYSGLQNVSEMPSVRLTPGFSTIYRTPKAGITFCQLLDRVSRVDENMRIRFVSPHPKDFPDEVLQVIRERPNICKSLHIPAQSGSTAVLEKMRRGYSRDAYLKLVRHIRCVLGDQVNLSSDFIAGFCGETHEDHMESVSLIEEVKFDQAFTFAYSMREKTPAHRRYVDDVPESVKKSRLQDLINVFHKNLKIRNQQLIGQFQLILVEGISKKNKNEWFGRNDGNKKVIFNKRRLPMLQDYISISKSANGQGNSCCMPDIGRDMQAGDYVVVKIADIKGFTLYGEPIGHTTLTEFEQLKMHLNDKLVHSN